MSKRGQLVKLCTLCEAGAEVIERAMTEAIGTALLEFKARAESAEQQLAAQQGELQARDATLLDMVAEWNKLYEVTTARAEQAEQQLTAAEEAARVEARLQATYRDEARSHERAQVLAQVKALMKSERETATDGTSIIEFDSMFPKLGALQPDPSLAVSRCMEHPEETPVVACLKCWRRDAVLSEADREQALEKAANRATRDQDFAEARRLLRLPQEPTR